MDAFASLLDIFFLAMLLYIVHIYTDPLHTTSKFFSGEFFKNHPVLPIVIFFLLFSIKNYFALLVTKKEFQFVFSVASRLSEKNIRNYFSGSYFNYVNNDSSIHIRKIGQQPIEFGHYILGSFQQIISQIILIAITVGVILFFNSSLFLLLFLMLVPPIIFTALLIKRKTNYLRKTAKTINEKNLQNLQEAISGYIESNVYQRNDFFSKRYAASQEKFNDFVARQHTMLNLPSRLIEVFAVFGLLSLILINTFSSGANTIQLITIGAFMAAAYKIIPGSVKILNCLGLMRTYDFLTEILKKNNLWGASVKQQQQTIHSIEFKDVSFSYKGEAVLKNFSMTLKPGDFVGISGRSGKGKTTIANLLLGFIDPERGNILINDQSTSSLQRQEYWNKISYIKQQPFFIHDTILKNIILDDTEYNKIQLEKSLEIAGLADLVSQHSEGIYTIISENGKNISGGQRKRMMIARAIYKNADLFILDEPFSELDQSSENCLLNYFKSLAGKGKIVLFISHNKESLSHCNKTISLDERSTANTYSN